MLESQTLNPNLWGCSVCQRRRKGRPCRRAEQRVVTRCSARGLVVLVLAPGSIFAHPRTTGTFTRTLGHCRELGLMTRNDVVSRCSSPAGTIKGHGLRDLRVTIFGTRDRAWLSRRPACGEARGAAERGVAEAPPTIRIFASAGVAQNHRGLHRFLLSTHPNAFERPV